MSFFVCRECGFGSASWYGKCPDCGRWGTLIEKPEFSKPSSKRSEAVKRISVTSLSSVKSGKSARMQTGIFELDRVLGGGFVPGEVVLLTGEPGIGKSTLVLQALKNFRTLYISGEESGGQVKSRAERLKVNLDNFLFSQDLQVEGIVESVTEMREKIDIVIIDSIQTIYSKDIKGAVGSVSQLKETTKHLVELAKNTEVIVLIIGHITKEGITAGPKSLEHFVDAVLNFEGDKVSSYRMLRANKNRFGTTDEIGIFEMKKNGLAPIDNPLVFLEGVDKFDAGKSVVGISQGQRPLFFEIQSLTVPTALAYPRRVVKGLDYNKVLLLIAVLQKFIRLPLDRFDIYVNVVGGVSVKGPAADLGLVASLISSFKGIALPKTSLFIGEVGLLGEVRKVYFEEKILNEGRRLGFKKIFSSNNIKDIKDLNLLIGKLK